MLVRRGAPVSAGSNQGVRRRSVKVTDVALELGSGQPAAAADVHRSEISGLHEGVEGGPSDAEHVRGLFGRQQQRLAGQSVRPPLWVLHVVLLARRLSGHAVVRLGTPTGEGAVFARLVTLPRQSPVFLRFSSCARGL